MKIAMNKGYFFIILTAFLYSTQEITAKMLSSAKLDPFQVVFIVFLIAAIMMTFQAGKDLKKRRIKIHPKDIGYFFVLGTLCIPVSLSLMQIAVGYIQASVVAIIFSTNAVFTVPFAYLLLKEKITKSTALSMGLCLLGVAAILNPFSLDGMSDKSNLIGIGLSALSAVSFSLYSVLAAKKIHYYGGYILNCFSFFCGVFVIFGLLLVTDRPVFSGITLDTLGILLYMGICIKGFGYIFYLKAIRDTSAVIASTVFLIKTALAPLLAFLILGDRLYLNTILGIVLVFAGSCLGYRAKNKGVQA